MQVGQFRTVRQRRKQARIHLGDTAQTLGEGCAKTYKLRVPGSVEFNSETDGCFLFRWWSCDTWPMETIEQVLGWADGHVENLAQEMYWERSEFGGYWAAVEREAKSRIRARVTSAFAFLDQFTGPGSHWSEDARDVFNNKGDHQSMESGARAVGDVIKEWVLMVRSGQAKPRLVEFSVRAASSTDLLEQVRALNADKGVVPAAPIVLAGAALEIALRSAVGELGLTVEGRGSIDAYATALRQVDVLDKQDIKDITQMAGLRNDAAHGHLELLNRGRAGMMEQQVNLFLARLDQAVQQSS